MVLSVDLAPVPKPLVWPVGLSAMSFALLVGLASGSIVPAYYPLVLTLGALGWRHRIGLSSTLQDSLGRWPFWGMVAAGYGGVIAEETIAGVLHAMFEGASPLGVLKSAGQFILFNLFAFTGIILSLAFWRERIAFRRWDLFWMAGCWGLFAESSLWALIGNPLAGGLLILPNMAVYAVILWPLMMTCPFSERGVRRWHMCYRLGAVWLLALVLAVPSIAIVSALRSAHPLWFPDCAYIACR